MRVFKFGGASVKDADAVRNVKDILDLYPHEKIVVIISAMGKTTNALEKIVEAKWNNEETEFLNLIKEVENYHTSILENLVENKKDPIFNAIHQVFTELKSSFKLPKNESYDCEYDQIVSLGEILSTKIVTSYLQLCCKKCEWQDARTLICTDRTYRNAEVDWVKTEKAIKNELTPIFKKTDIIITQGFISRAENGLTTTLGREGSDYSAGIVAFCIDADNVTIWKDVPGMLNADPKYFDDTIKLKQISFKEAIELAYYGASVIHPKTIKPLQNKNIPLYVKSFIHPKESGTIIQASMDQDHLIPSFIFKMNQLLISITPKDFSFIVEKNLSSIFRILTDLGVKINIMQNSALSFSFLVDADKNDIQKILNVFSGEFDVKYNENVELVTIRHYNESTINRVCGVKQVLMEQRTRETSRLVLKP
jgi:aspartate kinase